VSRPRPGNLPTLLTRLIGRQPELAHVCALLRSPEVRLVTITGSGGGGKTRLALAVAQQLAPEFPDGVWLVDLAPIREAVLVPSAIGQTLGLGLDGLASELTLSETLAGWRALILLDNFEHLLDAALRLPSILGRCPDMKLLVTSRAPLRLTVEQELALPPLSVPDPNASFDTIAESEAVSLFVQRAQAVRADFALTDANAAPVAELCRRLDGLPLAIELAASRVRALSPAALQARLDDRLGLLTGGARDLPPRQQTLRATLDWSADLLGSEEGRLFRRLSVFAGGCTLAAATAIGADQDNQAPAEFAAAGPSSGMLDILDGLVSQSLIRADPADEGEPRFAMLETIRAYALDRLEASGELEETQRRHAQYFLALAEELAPRLRGPEPTSALGSLQREHPNLRAAFCWALTRGEPDIAVRLGAALWRFWWELGHLSDGQQWLEAVLASGPMVSTAARSRSLSGMWAIGPYLLGRDPSRVKQAVAFFAETLELCRALGDARGVAIALGNLGQLAAREGDAQRARSLLEESLALLRELGDRERIAAALDGLGSLLLTVREPEAATLALRESLALHQALGDREGAGGALAILSRVLGTSGATEDAWDCLREGLALAGEQGSKPLLADLLDSLADLQHRAGQDARAAISLGAAAGLREAFGVSASPLTQPQVEETAGELRAILGEHTFEARWLDGRGLPFDDLLAQVARDVAVGSGPGSAKPVERAFPLTPREQEVARLIARGFTNRDIAEELVIAEGTAERHVANIMHKLAYSSRAQVAAWAVGHGLLASSGVEDSS
jgi:predicted ATPase/DNA-binding CsgD family transcriptional regulator